MVAGYEDLLPPQKQWFDHLMSTPSRDWPPSLQEYARVEIGGKAICGDLVADVVGRWVKEQRD